jgi:hypothetical protein
MEAKRQELESALNKLTAQAEEAVMKDSEQRIAHSS